MRYSIVIEKGERNYSAYLPDVPGCIATGSTPEATVKNLAKALEMHLEGLREDGLPMPEPSTQVDYITLEEAG
ncbi:MAG: type II toxin-antitoxin system HicB family antitoxin [Syntrophobacteraceae bacterium]|nr:type II toxin-antitoxin system HicB family antitoxin [Syntrophobacteraceae bacterium]